MAVDFSKLQIGKEYERPYLAKLWGYAGYQAISRGVVTPSGKPYIILFVTEQKQASLTQYNDYLEDGRLHWEGEKKHGSDRRVIGAGFGPDEIHLFHRKVHHSPFVYVGRIFLEQHNLRTFEPSQFIFYLASTIQNANYDPVATGDISPERATENVALKSSRRGQGVFRDGLIRLWGSCAVSGYDRPKVLIASHIKPWKVANNAERLDPYNGLLLQPNIDKLFDIGLISFDRDGKLLNGNGVNSHELSKLGIAQGAMLTVLPKQTGRYLRYHREHCFLG